MFQSMFRRLLLVVVIALLSNCLDDWKIGNGACAIAGQIPTADGQRRKAVASAMIALKTVP